MSNKKYTQEQFEAFYNRPLTKQQEDRLIKLYKEYPYGANKLYVKYKEIYKNDDPIIFKTQINTWLKKNKNDLPRYKQPLRENQLQILNKVYYEEHNYFGLKKLYKLVKEKYPDSDIKQNQIQNWLYQQQIYQVNKRITTRKATKPFSSFSSTTLAIDLIDFSNKSYKGYNYILSCIDLFSRYCWLFPIKQKKADTVKNIIEQLIKDNPNFKVLLTDNGLEFKFEIDGIRHIYTKTHTPTNNANIERLNRLIQEVLRKFFQLGYKDWSNQLIIIADNINKSYQSTIKDNPYNVYYKYSKEQKLKLVEMLKKQFQNKNPIHNDKLIPLTTNVRILNREKIKTKNKNLLNWSEDTYVVYKQIISDKPNVRNAYKLINTRTGLVEKGTFNSSEMQIIKGIIYPPVVKNKIEGILKNRELKSLELQNSKN